MSDSVLIAFSGGVDSATTARILQSRGHPVHAVMMLAQTPTGQGCATPDAVEAASRLAGALGISFTVVDCSPIYQKEVLDNFKNEYRNARTPNPCVRCNPLVKFSVLPALARRAGVRFDRMATGHYARIRQTDAGPALMRGVDRRKDQSYFLYRLNAETLAKTLFPLGGMTKEQVRDLARELDVPVFDKPDSQDFFNGDYQSLLGFEDREGEIVTTSGEVVGRHTGYWKFTIGQRKGLGVAWREALFVVSLDAGNNRVVVGPRRDQLRTGCVAGDLVFNRGVPASGTHFSGKLRSAQPLRGMTVDEAEDGKVKVIFDEPVHGVAPGQSLVLYDGEYVIGGGIIESSF